MSKKQKKYRKRVSRITNPQTFPFGKEYEISTVKGGQARNYPCTKEVFQSVLNTRPDLRMGYEFHIDLNADGVVVAFSEVQKNPTGGKFDQVGPDGKMVKARPQLVFKDSGDGYEVDFIPEGIDERLVDMIHQSLKDNPDVQLGTKLANLYKVSEIRDTDDGKEVHVFTGGR